ncbi:Ribonuclease H1 [Trametes pubescens]|uniref:ribonuclease H n=1 Tax=Trametes pubescens TaxID=154538 RepID=A0A1M2W6Y8_TRAPU|nr:Ribonuclease H1 [Trametes pubescens]OJT11724.1 Ribonuclease H1 [Trametes pubescens]OJT15586.1 Ribonuclease H1 [Trametes pubescens]
MDDYSVLTAILERWCRASRAKFNAAKTEVIPLGTMEQRAMLVEQHHIPGTVLVLPESVRIVPDGATVRILGARVGNAADPAVAWQPMLDLVRSNLSRWEKRRPTMYGKKLAVGLEVGSRSQFLAVAQGMPESVEIQFTRMVSAFMWGKNARPLVSRDVLFAPVAMGGLALLDVKARNEAMELMWLKTYLKLGPSRPRWAHVADALFAHAVSAVSSNVDRSARVNPFLQSWTVSTRKKAGLPAYLRGMVMAAKKYGVSLAPLLPDDSIKLALPIWYHVGLSPERSVANAPAAQCLRERHGVRTVADCERAMQRLCATLNGELPHTYTVQCPCLCCISDRDTLGCVNPHRCALAAQRAVEQLQPLWQPGVRWNADCLSLTKSRKRENRTARAADEDITFDPSLCTSLPLATGFRVFTGPVDRMRAPPRRAPRAFEVAAEEVTVYTDGSCTGNGQTNAVAGSGVWFGPQDPRNMAERVPGADVTNQTAEMHAVVLTLDVVPPFAPLHIVSDSKFVVDGLTLHAPRWEEKGWIGVADSVLVRNVLARLRSRSALTTFRWVKGHSGVEGNEAADVLAAAGSEKEPDSVRRLSVPPVGFVADGVCLWALTQRLAYQGIKLHRALPRRRRTERTVQQVLAALEDWKLHPTEAALWRSLRRPDIRRSLRDFWWKALHGALRVGEFWRNIPGYEQRAICGVCDAEESLEHILVECACPTVALIWELVTALLGRAHVVTPRLTYGVLLGAPCLSLMGLVGEGVSCNDRLLRIVVTESVHLIWKLRCERVIEPTFDAERGHSRSEVRAKWLAAINRRLQLDQHLVHPRLGKAALHRDTVLATWNEVLCDRTSLPEDWILMPGVLVGSTPESLHAGVG